jgi:hypothetical protein
MTETKLRFIDDVSEQTLFEAFPEETIAEEVEALFNDQGLEFLGLIRHRFLFNEKRGYLVEINALSNIGVAEIIYALEWGVADPELYARAPICFEE